jgi:hypothetical protein
MTGLELLGLAIIAVVFLGIASFMAFDIGWQAMLGVWAVTLAIGGVLALGVALASGTLA